MSRVLSHIICVILASSIVISCKRQELCSLDSNSDNAAIQISIDWSQSNIDEEQIYNVSLYAYPKEGGSPYVKISGNIEQTSLNLPAGLYSLLIFNDIAGDIEGMNFVDVDSRDEFRAETIERSSLSDIYYDVASDESLSLSMGALAAWRMEELEVTEEMVWCGYCDEEYDALVEVELSVAPTPITIQCIVTLGVENLNNASAISGILKGFASGAYIYTNEHITSYDKTDLYSMNFTSRTYEDDNIDGTAMGEVITFGKAPDVEQSYELVIDIILNSGELVSFTRDVTDQIKDQDGVIITIDLSSEPNIIVLPEATGTGFGVESWGDNESIELL